MGTVEGHQWRLALTQPTRCRPCCKQCIGDEPCDDGRGVGKALSGSIPAYAFYLVVLSKGGDGGTLTMAPDVSLTNLFMSATNGKVALVSSTTPLSGCPSGPSVVDFVGYGSANCNEGSAAAPALSITEALFRNSTCNELNDNSADFNKSSPNPSNSGFSHPCTCANVLISQVYGGGENAGAPYRSDFVELHNTTSHSINLGSWALQYTSAASTPPLDGGSEWRAARLSGSIAAGGYFLVAVSSGGDGGVLPSPDLDLSSSPTSQLSMSATNGKIALTANPNLITGCPTIGAVVDLVGYGAANCYEGPAAAGALSLTSSLVRVDACFDSNSNSLDFLTVTPAPRSSSTTPLVCR